MKEHIEAHRLIRFPSFFEDLKEVEDLEQTVTIGSNEQNEIEAWIWNNVFKKESVGEEGAWLYEHMQRTSEVLESAGINTHNFEHVKTVMVNACAIFMMTQGLYLKDKFDLSTEEGQKKLFEKLSIVAVAGLFHDIGYLDCLEDETNFTKGDLDNHPLIGSEAVFDFGHKRIGKPLKRSKDSKNEKTKILVEKLLNSIFHPQVAEAIKVMGQDNFYKILRKVRSAISSHDSPDKQGGTDESAKLDNIGGEAIAVYLADKTHIGQRIYAGANIESDETINSTDDINLVHDRITYLITSEEFEIEYGKKEVVFRIKLNVKIPDAYTQQDYDKESFKKDFEKGFSKRYQHAQKVFRRLMHPEHLNNASAKLVIEANIDEEVQEVLQIPKSNDCLKGVKLSRKIR